MRNPKGCPAPRLIASWSCEDTSESRRWPVMSLNILRLIGSPLATRLETDSPETQDSPRRTWALWSLGAVLVAMLALPVPLIAPPPEPGTYLCGEFRELVGDHGYVKNCDSVALVHLAEHPEKILNESHPRQARPLFIMLGTFARAAATPFVGLVTGTDGTAPAQAGYLAINLALLAMAVGVAGRLLGGVDTPWPIIATVLAESSSTTSPKRSFGRRTCRSSTS